MIEIKISNENHTKLYIKMVRKMCTIQVYWIGSDERLPKYQFLCAEDVRLSLKSRFYI